MTWSIPICFDLWLTGIAGGAYSTAFLVDYFSHHRSRPLLRIATCLGIPLVLIGVLLLVLDLGNPLRFWHLFTEFKVLSPMSMGTWILPVWVVIAVTMVVLWRIDNKASNKLTARIQRVLGFLKVIGLVFAVLLMVYTGTLLAVNSNVLWSSTVLLPALFTASAISMGMAMLIIASLVINAVSKGKPVVLKSVTGWILGSTDLTIPVRTVAQIVAANVIVILIQMVVLIIYVVGLTTSVDAGAAEALRLIITGTLAIPFWLGVVLLAMLIPLVLYVINRKKDLEASSVRYTIALSSFCVVFGGLLLRAIIIVAGQIAGI